MNPIQQADDLFASVVGASVEQLFQFVITNENITAIRQLTNQYLASVANTLGVNPPPVI